MTAAEFQRCGVNDDRLAVHATGHLPAWLWSFDGTRILWANPVGAALFGARNGAQLVRRPIGPADPRRRQIAQLAGRLRTDGFRLERLRGFGAPLGQLLACACQRIQFPDGDGVLVVAAEPVGRPMPLLERLQRLVEDIDAPVAAFGPDGLFVGASDAARALMAFRSLSDAGLDGARAAALKDGRVEMPIGVGQIVLQRVGSGADIGLIALLAPGMTSQTPMRGPEPHGSAAQSMAASAAAPEREQPNAVEPLQDDAAAQSRERLTPTEAADQTGGLVVEPLPEQASGETTAVVDADFAAPTDAALLTGEAPAEFALAGEMEAEYTPAQGHCHADGGAAEEPRPAPASQSQDSLDAHAIKSDGDGPALPARHHPLRFTWAIGDDARFTLRSGEFIRLIGPRTAASFGRPWDVISRDLDPDRRVATAIASQSTWSGIELLWPVDPPGEPLLIELAGLPVFDAAGSFAGYRGFGVCRDLEALDRLAWLRRDDDRGVQHDDHAPPPRSLSAHSVLPVRPSLSDTAETDSLEAAAAATSSQPIEPEALDISQNVVPIRPTADPFTPALTPIENSAFNELARRLSARLDNESLAAVETPPSAPDQPEPEADLTAQSAKVETSRALPGLAYGTTQRERSLLDLVPSGILIYRLEKLVYANAAFLAWTGHSDLDALEAAGGLAALSIDPEASAAGANSGNGTPVKVAQAAHGHALKSPAAGVLSAISWDGAPALALILAPAAFREPTAIEPPPETAVEPAPGHASAEDLAVILDTAAEGILMFDSSGRIHSCNRSAEALFGRDGDALTHSNLNDLFAPESQRQVQDYFKAVAGTSAASLRDHGREVLGQVASGGLLPLAVTMGRTTPNGANFFAIFRDRAQARKTENELLAARKQADRFISAKADVLARISHEIRTPVNAIIGFSDVMIEERFGALGNERYVDYMKDIRGCGERVIAIISDLLDLARIETGELDLAFASQNLNELIEQCVAVMQPQANRQRIIVRTSLAHHLPPVSADARALRQIALNLISNSIHLANAGGQVIVSTALSDLGDVVLRIRDTGHGLNDNELAEAMEPFRTRAPADQGPDSAAVNLSLTRALVEANRARFNIKTAPQSGTLVEVVFSTEKAQA